MREQAEHNTATELFEVFFEQEAMGMALRAVDPNNSLWLRVNQKFCDMLGYTREELLQLTSVDISMPDERHLAVKYNEQLLRGDFRSYSRDKRYLRKDGTAIWTNLWLSAVLDADGKPTQIIAVIHDISEQKKAETALMESEARFRAVLDNAPVCINLKDTEGRYLFANKPYEDWWGRSAEGVIGKTAGEFLTDPYSVNNMDASEKVVLETGTSCEREISVKNPRDGQLHDRLLIKFPVKSPDGSIIGLGTFAVDITKRKQAEKALQESEKLFAKAFHASPAACAITNPKDGVPYDVNEAWVQLLGYSREEAIGQSALELGLWADISKRARFVDLIERNGSVHSFEAKFQNKGGAELDLLISAERFEVGAAPRLFIVVHDITNQLAAEKQLVEHRDHLQELVDIATQELKSKAEELQAALGKEKELNELQRQFVSMASHEFRTPLSIIDGSAQFLARKGENITTEYMLSKTGKIRDAVTRMTRLMESTLIAARMEEGKIKIEIGPCDIGKVVREVCAGQQEISQDYVISCDLVELPQTIQADCGSVEQVLTNLLANAVKYAPDAPDIEVVARTQGHQVVISVRDHGIGIDAEDLGRIGERFFRARTSTGIAGTGIGLNLVNILVKMHDGSVKVESKKGEGSTFTVRLPIAGPEQSEQAETRVA